MGWGGERVTLNLTKALRSKGVDVEFVVAQNEGRFFEQVPDDVSLLCLNAPRRWCLVRALPSLLRHLFYYTQMDVICPNWGGFEFIIVFVVKLIKMRRRPRFVFIIHNVSRSLKELPLIRRLLVWISTYLTLRLVDAIVAVSHGVAEDFARSFNIALRKIQVIYNPIVDEELLKKAEEPLDHPWFQKGEPPVILAAGRLHVQKDFPTLLRAFALVRREIPSRLVILGEGEKRKELEELAQELGIREHLDLPGFVENPYKYMKRAAVFVLSSQWEGLPTVLVEAMACGCPVVSTDCPSGPREILENGKWGKLVPPGDPVKLAEAIKEVLTNRTCLPADYSTYVLNSFSSFAVAERYLSVFFPGWEGRASKQ